MPTFILSLFCLLLSISNVHAGAAVAKQQQMKAMQQQAYQQAYQQAVAEKQAAEMQAYQQAVAQYQAAQYQAAQYQAAQYKAAQEYLVAKHIQEAIMKQVAQRISANQINKLQMEMVQHVVQQQLVAQVAAQIQANQVAQVQDVMIAQAIQEAVVKLGLQAYVNQEAQDRMAAQAVLATRQAAATGQAAQIQSAKDAVQNLQVQSYIDNKVDQFLEHAQTRVPRDVFKETASNVLIKKITSRMGQGPTEITPEMVTLAVNDAANMLGIQAVLAAPAKPSGFEPALGYDVVDVVDIEDVWKKLDENGRAWNLLIDDQAKVMTVNEFIERYRKKKVRISKSPDHYAQMIDDMAMQNPKLLDNPFMGIIQMIAVMEYDFDFGGDRDEMARKLLGPMYESNKQRVSLGH